MTIKKLIKKAHKNAKEKGFHDKEIEVGTMLMLIVSELREAVETHRINGLQKNIYTMMNFDRMKDEEFKLYFRTTVKDTFPDEITDTFIRLADMCGKLNIDIEKYIKLKMRYNSLREKKHGKKYW